MWDGRAFTARPSAFGTRRVMAAACGTRVLAIPGAPHAPVRSSAWEVLRDGPGMPGFHG